MMAGIQIVGLIFALIMSYLIFLNFKRKEINIAEFVFWLVIWALFVVLTFAPRIVDPLLQSLHIVRALDFYVIIGFMFLFVFNFAIYRIVRKNDRKVELIVQRIAYRDAEERSRARKKRN
jgi:hypothetical protein